jgi:hypothetical protein
LLRERGQLVCVAADGADFLICLQKDFCDPPACASCCACYDNHFQPFKSDAEDGGGYVLVPGWVDAPDEDGGGLDGDDWGKGVEVEFVDAAVDDAIAEHAENDEEVEDGVEEVVVEDEIEAAEGGVHEHGGADEEEAAVVVGLFAPVDGEGDADAEDEHIGVGDGEEGLRFFVVEGEGVEAGHDDGDGAAEDDHDGGETGAEPAEEAMDLDFFHTDESGLKDEEDDPEREGSAVEPEECGAGRVGVEEVGVDGAAETDEDGGGEDERHGEVEITAEEGLEVGLVGGGGAGFGDIGYGWVADGHGAPSARFGVPGVDLYDANLVTGCGIG